MIHLNGLSGCKLELVDDNIVRKHSSSQAYNQRLYYQISKQKLFSNLTFRNIDSPKVLDVRLGDLYSFDMEYVSGNSFFEFFSASSIGDIQFVLSSLFGYFDELIDNQKFYTSKGSKKRILDKIKSLKDVTNYPNELSFLEEVVKQTNLHLPQSFCHGDLTFSNILFHKNKLYFIDFLDCFIDSFLVDFVKLKQDLFYHWSLKEQKIGNRRIYQIYSFLWGEMEKRYSKYIDTIEFDILDFLNSLRIDPYLTEDRQRCIIEVMLKTSSLYENINRSYGGTV
jgi:hypothetical protein